MKKETIIKEVKTKQEVEVYTTEDGRHFNSQKEAEEHEEKLKQEEIESRKMYVIEVDGGYFSYYTYSGFYGQEASMDVYKEISPNTIFRKSRAEELMKINYMRRFENIKLIEVKVIKMEGF